MTQKQVKGMVCRYCISRRMTVVSGTPTQVKSLVGRVKWFNNKAGTGFITITDGEMSGTDIFVHHSGIVTESKQFLYLVQGEYVEFDLAPAHKESNADKTRTYEFQAGNVHGIKGGKLMCETRLETRQVRTAYKSNVDGEEETSEPVKQPRTRRVESGSGRGRGDGRGPRREPGRGGRGAGRGESEKDWTLVKNNTKK